MERKRLVGLIVIFLCFITIVFAEQTENVSLIQLIANPKDHHGKYVRVIGYVELEFEGDAIYLSSDDAKYGLTRNGVWLELSEGVIVDDAREYDRRFCLVEGAFNAQNKGHMGLWSGAIENIKRFEVWKIR